MRLLLYNIRYGAGIGRQFHFPFPYSGYLKPVNGNFEKIVQYIKTVNPDIVGLLETDFGSYRVEYRNQAERIAGELNHTAVYQSKYHSDSLISHVPLLNKQGNAVLTGRPPKRTKFHFLQDGVKRLLIQADLADCTLFLVHLSLKRQHRRSQLKELQSLVASCTRPVIVAGDFNAMRGPQELSQFLDATGLISANTEGAASWPSRVPVLELDYIFHSPCIQSQQFHIPRILLSDHKPLVWDFTINRRRRMIPDRPPFKMTPLPPAGLGLNRTQALAAWERLQRS
jgi:endonuclease/exonuclease/phosphatase family metal-dependent hydrolase